MCQAIDVWNNICVSFVFLALLEYALVNYAARADARYETVVIIVIVLVFLGWNGRGPPAANSVCLNIRGWNPLAANIGRFSPLPHLPYC